MRVNNMLNKTQENAARTAKIRELTDQVNAKALELQSFTEKVEAMKASLKGEEERKAKLWRESFKLQEECKDLRLKVSDYRHLVIEAEGNKELHARKAKELKAEHDKLQNENLLLSKQFTGLMESTEMIQKDFVEKQKAVNGLKNQLDELEKTKSRSLEELESKWAAIQAKEVEMKSIAENQQRTYTRMVTFAGMIEHNTRRINALYSKGDIKIKIKVPVEEWKPFILK